MFLKCEYFGISSWKSYHVLKTRCVCCGSPHYNFEHANHYFFLHAYLAQLIYTCCLINLKFHNFKDQNHASMHMVFKEINDLKINENINDLKFEKTVSGASMDP